MENKKGSKIGQKKGRYSHHIEIDGEMAHQTDAVLIPKNHMKQNKMYSDFCVLNQEFLKYVMHLNMTASEYRILMFLLSYMDMKNRVIIDAEMIEYHLQINQSNVNKYIKKLEKNKIIYKRNLGYKKGAEVLINFDIITPHMAYKDKNSHESVVAHKNLMRKDLPYIKQCNINGDIDFVNPDTGEVFHVVKKIN